MKDNDESRAVRGKARASWPIRRFQLGSEPDENLNSSTSAEERLAMVGELSLRAWFLTGRPWPDYDRHNIPGRIFRP